MKDSDDLMTQSQPLPSSHTERDLLASIRIIQSLENFNTTHELFDSLTELATLYIGRGETQEGADVLAWVLRQSDLPQPIATRARALFEDLEASICPRVIYDAQEFARYATHADIMEYIFST